MTVVYKEVVRKLRRALMSIPQERQNMIFRRPRERRKPAANRLKLIVQHHDQTAGEDPGQQRQCPFQRPVCFRGVRLFQVVR